MQPNTQQPYQPQQPAPAGVYPAQPQAPAAEHPIPQNVPESVLDAAQPQPTPTLPQITAPSPQQGTVVPPVKANPNSTQNTLLISEIRDGLVVMNDGSFRAVVACKSINFDLMSERERESVEYSYQSFLNSLYFPIQIFIRSERVDIGPYLDRLEKIRRSQDNMLLGVLMDDYINFISTIAEETNIMDKNFYIVVPYYPTGDLDSAVNSSKNMLANLFTPQAQARIRIDSEAYNKARDELRNRVNTVVNGLFQMGVRSIALTTKQLGELYYNVYNPDTAVREPLGDFDNLTAPIVTKGQGEAPQPHLERGVM